MSEPFSNPRDAFLERLNTLPLEVFFMELDDEPDDLDDDEGEQEATHELLPG